MLPTLIAILTILINITPSDSKISIKPPTKPIKPSQLLHQHHTLFPKPPRAFLTPNSKPKSASGPSVSSSSHFSSSFASTAASSSSSSTVSTDKDGKKVTRTTKESMSCIRDGSDLCKFGEKVTEVTITTCNSSDMSSCDVVTERFYEEIKM
jgi:hypothetical protein